MTFGAKGSLEVQGTYKPNYHCTYEPPKSHSIGGLIIGVNKYP